MWSYEHTVETKAPAETVWALWSDVTTWSRWDDDIEWATLEGPFAAGSRGRLKPQGFVAAGFGLAAVKPGVSYTVEQRLPLARLQFHHELAGDDGTRTRFTHRVTIDGPLGPLFAAAFGGRMKRNFGPIMRHLAEEAEAVAAASDATRG